jgi:hypothetical protein
MLGKSYTIIQLFSVGREALARLYFLASWDYSNSDNSKYFSLKN